MFFSERKKLVPNRSKKLLVMIALIAITSCSTSPEKLEPEILYEKDLTIEVNKKEYWGIAIPPEAKSYEIKVHAHDDNDYVDIKSCGRFRHKEDKGSKATFMYEPMPGIEDTGECFIDIFSGSKKNQSGWARVLLKNEKKFNLPAYLKCNGTDGNFVGTSACDALKGLEAEITFETEVLTQKEGKCVLPPSSDRKSFRFKIQRGDCAYLFKAIGEDLWHVLFISGFDRSLYRNN